MTEEEKKTEAKLHKARENRGDVSSKGAGSESGVKSDQATGGVEEGKDKESSTSPTDSDLPVSEQRPRSNSGSRFLTDKVGRAAFQID